jgi:hypothetical protein
VPGVSGGVDHGPVLAGDGIIELHAGTESRVQGGVDHEDVIVARRGEIFAFDFGYGQHEPPGFDLPVGHSQMPEQLGPADLEPAQIIGVINDTHGIRVTVYDPVGGAVCWGGGLWFHFFMVAIREGLTFEDPCIR